ncbi:MAG: DUF3298 and DUF4163 domain-containing protein, partial [Clostridia bacterium]
RHSPLNLTVENFVVSIPARRGAEERINGRINMQVMEFMRRAERELFPLAIESYKEAVAGGYPVRPFEAMLIYQVTYNENGTLSMYRDRYEYTGGAHGNTVRRSDTFSLESGRQLPLGSFFPRGVDYLKLIVENVLLQAENNMSETPGIYFDDYPELIIKYFNPSSFYLTPDGIAIYYQQYEIAPYASGIPVFIVPYEELGIIRTHS